MDLESLGIPGTLIARARVLAARPLAEGDFVLLWLRLASRAHENPALNLALALAEHANCPVFVIQALSERYPYASWRHHQFIIEGAKDLHAELAERGIASAFVLEQAGQNRGAVLELARRARALVVDDAPIDFLRRWDERVASAIAAPMVAVDSSCLVPMIQVPRAFERAYEFRSATRALRERALREEHSEASVRHPPYQGELPFEPFDFSRTRLESRQLSDLLASCEIDHGLPPVVDSPGGSRAGYARWQRFREKKLARYDSQRNDPLKDGTSRLSPYLHHGMVSPFRIAREAAQLGGPGAEKFLDELLIWRELAWSWCHHKEPWMPWRALPDWARRELAEHRRDPRAASTWDELSRAQTASRLWNVAQASLIRRGELHNSLRMTWGKALPGLTASPEQALARLFELNDRFALDGRDPNSVAGLLWCLGLFDRPFEPPAPVLGRVRPRPLEDQAARFDLARLEARVARSDFAPQGPVAIIGAGITGLSAARALVDQGLSVRLFDKGRRAGGRLASREHRSSERYPELSFDHGLQYLTARDPLFQAQLQALAERGVIAPWEARCFDFDSEQGLTPSLSERPRLVAQPTMSALTEELARGLEIEFDRVLSIETSASQHLVTGESGQVYGPFSALILTIPLEQCQALWPRAELADKAPMRPCWTLMLAFDEPQGWPFDALRLRDHSLAWMARNSSKPGRREIPETWVIQMNPDWSAQNLDLSDPEESLLRELLDFLSEQGFSMRAAPIFRRAHRWRYALPALNAEKGEVMELDRLIFAGGDWTERGTAEGAWRAGRRLAGQLLAELCRRQRSQGPGEQGSLF